MSARVRIGELLITAGLITRAQLEQALEQQRTQGAGGRRLGQLLLDLGFVSEVQLTKVLSQQLSVPWVSLQHIDFSRQLLNLVPRELAEEFCLIPVYVRHERKVGDTLYVAMEDPTLDDAVRGVMSAAGMPVKSMIAAPTDIRAAIHAFYGADRPSVVHLEGTAGAETGGASSARARVSARPRAQGVASAEPSSSSASSSSSTARNPPPLPAASSPHVAQVAAREAPTMPERRPTSARPAGERASFEFAPPTIPDGVAVASPEPSSVNGAAPRAASAPPAERAAGLAPVDPAASASPSAPISPASTSTAATAPDANVRRVAKMISLTLLDGTTIKLPSQPKRRSTEVAAEEPAPPAGDAQLTTRDLIAALRIAAEGGGSTDGTVGGYRWEAIVAALLAVLMRKQLVTDWEFVEELNKRA